MERTTINTLANNCRTWWQQLRGGAAIGSARAGLAAVGHGQGS
jgi:hypothetical protein